MRNLFKTFVLLLLIFMIPTGTAKAAKISKKKIILEPNQIELLSVTGTDKKVKWSSSDKQIATVSKYGIVKAKKIGKATITAKCGKKKYKCKVTVKLSNNENQEDYSNLTISQKNAIQKAQSYLKTQAFSYEGLIKQLEFEKYSHEDAVYAVDNCGADWFEQSIKKAKSYLNSQAFSYNGLKKQLIFEKFTEEQALYGVENCEADWFEQAAKKASSYLSNMSFSRDGLIKQLEFDGFTNEEAIYGVEQNGYSVTETEDLKIPDLTGIWRSENNDGSYQEAVITNDSIEINWVSDNGETKSIYWIGTFSKPTEPTNSYNWISEKDKEATEFAILASQDDTKEFYYSNGIISYKTSALGTTTTTKLTKVG